MTGKKELLTNFRDRYCGKVKFGNNHYAPIMGYGEIVQKNITIKKVAYVEGLGHNLFSIGQFCDKGLEVNSGLQIVHLCFQILQFLFQVEKTFFYEQIHAF